MNQKQLDRGASPALLLVYGFGSLTAIVPTGLQLGEQGDENSRLDWPVASSGRRCTANDSLPLTAESLVDVELS